MSKLRLVVEIPDVVDPTLEDPEEIAAQVVTTYTEWATAQGYDPVDLVSAEWGDDE